MLNVGSLSTEDIKTLYDNLDSFSLPERTQILAVVEELERRNHAKKCELDLIEFCKHIDPQYIVAAHHRKLAYLLMEIAYGQKDRVAVSIPPRHGKSHLISTLFPAWFLGKYPDKKVLMASHTGDLAVDFGRKVRNIVNSQAYKDIFPNVTLAQDSKSAGRWSTNSGGEYFSCGVGASIAGRGADLLLVDDPHSEQDLLNGNFDSLEKTYQWFTTGARTRLMSGGRVAIVHCMVGDTRVLLADNTEKLLRDVRPGDVVASYNGSELVPAKVLNWANQGLDRIFTIKTTSGRILRANWKHPLLAQIDGELKWTKVKDLQVGSQLIAVSNPMGKYLEAPQDQRPRLKTSSAVLRDALSGSTPSESAHTTITKIDANSLLYLSLQNGVSGEGCVAQKKDVAAPQKLNTLQKIGGYVTTTIAKRSTPEVETGAVQKKTVMRTLSTGMVLAWKSTTSCLKNKMVNALSVYAPQDQTIPQQIGKVNLGLTTATAGKMSEHYYAMHATSSSVGVTQKKHYCEPLSTYELTCDEIVEITLDGYEDVFDIQVEGTENFIAGGVISHNTRWHMDDLIGHLVKDGGSNEDADQYEVFEFPAILDTDNGPKALWPEKFDLDALKRTKASMPTYQWNAQYMQTPTAEEAAIIKREWWQKWTKEDPPRCEYVIMTLDAAAESHNRADFTALATWGVFSDDRLTNGASHLILLNVINVRVEFPELKDLTMQEYKDWEPDALIVEKKSAGTQLYQELRRMGIPVQEFTPSKSTGDKIARLNAVADILRSGMVWYPEGRRWAEELIEQCVAFPYGSHDDMVDVTSMALARFRQGGFITLPTDMPDEVQYFKSGRRAAYY
jgi:predicted phage terminase large subunit-like protein